MNANRNSIIAIVVAVLALGAAAAALGVFGGGELGTTNFDDLALSGDLSVGDDVTIADDLAVTGDTTFSGNVTGVISNDLNGAAIVLDPGGTSNLQATANFKPILTLGGTPTAANFTVKNSAGTAVAVIGGDGKLTVIGGQDLTGHLTLATAAPSALVTGTAVAPAAVLQPVSMATAGTVPITVPSAGRVVCLWNTGSQGATIADSGNQVLAGNITLGQYDVLCGISDGTRFIEITRSNN